MASHIAAASLREIFLGKDLRLTFADRGSSAIFVTFSHLIQEPPASGFGEPFFAKYRLSSLAFIAQRNHWWQSREMEQALAAASTRLDACRAIRRIGYGSSMGAYGALQFSHRLKLDDVLALSPQFSVDRRQVPFERRFDQHTRGLDFIFRHLTDEQPASATIIYDPADPDRKHADLYSEAMTCRTVVVPFAGHPVGHFLRDAALLGDLVRHFAAGSFDAAAFRVAVRRGRRGNPGYFAQMAQVMLARRKPDVCERLARMALALDPESMKAARLLTQSLHSQGRSSEALEAARLTCRLRPTYNDRRHCGELLLIARRDIEALAWFDELTAEFPDEASAHRGRALALSALNNREEAARAARRAHSLAADDPRFAGLRSQMEALLPRRPAPS